MGAWLSVNGEAIYNTSVFQPKQNYTANIYFTNNAPANAGYVILINGTYPQGGNLYYENGPIPKSGSQVSETAERDEKAKRLLSPFTGDNAGRSGCQLHCFCFGCHFALTAYHLAVRLRLGLPRALPVGAHRLKPFFSCVRGLSNQLFFVTMSYFQPHSYNSCIAIQKRRQQKIKFAKLKSLKS